MSSQLCKHKLKSVYNSCLIYCNIYEKWKHLTKYDCLGKGLVARIHQLTILFDDLIVIATTKSKTI